MEVAQVSVLLAFSRRTEDGSICRVEDRRMAMGLVIDVQYILFVGLGGYLIVNIVQSSGVLECTLLSIIYLLTTRFTCNVSLQLSLPLCVLQYPYPQNSWPPRPLAMLLQGSLYSSASSSASQYHDFQIQ